MAVLLGGARQKRGRMSMRICVFSKDETCPQDAT
jgi:hypothetical protein